MKWESKNSLHRVNLRFNHRIDGFSKRCQENFSYSINFIHRLQDLKKFQKKKISRILRYVTLRWNENGKKIDNRIILSRDRFLFPLLPFPLFFSLSLSLLVFDSRQVDNEGSLGYVNNLNHGGNWRLTKIMSVM